MIKNALVSSFFEIDIVDVQIIELYSYRIYDEQSEDRLQALAAIIVSDALIRLTTPEK
ncbi:hypothetical protein [Rosenbergiella collisarenosi]|uniref:hypothetical protein n=1 Tax=Rosenbergiella collisarenosi TaxID=1544695 RepID=UPI0012FE1406|nr:hypothetical protein [Rosenbergiella collisarenosi]MBT0720732.1 hypothetical protein [Rosenbergiella collisarenosi]